MTKKNCCDVFGLFNSISNQLIKSVRIIHVTKVLQSRALNFSVKSEGCWVSPFRLYGIYQSMEKGGTGCSESGWELIAAK